MGLQRLLNMVHRTVKAETLASKENKVVTITGFKSMPL